MTDPALNNRRRPEPKCPLRPPEPCTLCQLDVTGPHDCPVVYLVMSDDTLRAELAGRRRQANRPRSAPPVG